MESDSERIDRREAELAERVKAEKNDEDPDEQALKDLDEAIKTGKIDVIWIECVIGGKPYKLQTTFKAPVEMWRIRTTLRKFKEQISSVILHRNLLLNSKHGGNGN